MTVEVNDTDVTNSQPPEDTTDKSGSSRGSFNEKNKKKFSRLVLFGLLGVVVIVIIIAIIVFMKSNDDRTDEAIETEAFYVSKKIDGLYSDDDNYTFDDAVRDYEEYLLVGDNEFKVSIGIFYARFVLKNSGDMDAAVEIMKRVEPLIGGDKTLLVDYYTTLRSFYQAVDDELYNHYNDMIIDLVKVEDANGGGVDE